MEGLGLPPSVAIDAFRLILMIVQAAQTARRNKKTCRELAQRVEQIGDLLRSLQESNEMIMRHPETSAPLRELQETLRRACVLVRSCRRSSCVCRFFTGGRQAGRFRDVQNTIGFYLQLFPMISYIDSTRLLVRVIDAAVVPPPYPQGDQVQALGSLPSHARFQQYSFSQLVNATNDFSFEEQIEQGPLANLFKGQLHGSDVTIKRLSFPRSGQQLPQCINGYELLKNEVKILPDLQHTNIVKLLGFCAERSERILVYEYMENGSLEDVIFGRMRVLDWILRFQIIEGIAQGVLYLHEHSGLRIIHRDLNPSNILLDSKMSPKISAFDLAKILSPDVDEQTTDSVLGSIGFMAPEYMRKGTFSVKTDVYSFGVMVLEIISGKRWTKSSQERFYRDLLTWVAGVRRSGHRLARRLKKFVHPSLHDVSFRSRALPYCLSLPKRRRVLCQQQEIKRCVHVALLCIQEEPARRPAMSEVTRMLSLSPKKARLPRPRRPAVIQNREVAVRR